MNVNYSKVFIAVAAAVLLTGASARAAETDERIESSIRNSYVFKTYLKDDNIKAQSDAGVVTLKGNVGEESHSTLAENTAANLPGVRSVNNQLEFKGDRPVEKSDRWLAMKVKSSLLYHRNVSGTQTQVSVADGVVTLNGEVDNQAQKDLTAEYSGDIDGVKGVNNEMTIVAPSKNTQKTMGENIDDASITAQVKTALLYHRSTSGLKTGVKTNDGVVTLTGKAGNAAEKDLAAKYANDINGVKNVINNMTIDLSLSKN